MNNNFLTEKEIKESLLNVLKGFAAFCDANNLKYTLSSGTLLGAVRHKGFIPWDDDIDVDMPRDDYERLNELLKTKKIKDNYSFESLSWGNTDFPFAKIIDNSTEIVNSRTELMKSLWIDIFPVDGVTDKMVSNVNRLNKKLFIKYMLLGKAANEYNRVDSVSEKLKIFVSRLFGSARTQGIRIEKYAKRNRLKDSPYAADVVWGALKGYLKSDRFFENRVKLEFEGAYFYAPQDYEEYLTKMYGNYMQLPPENERDTHNLLVKRAEK